MSTQTMETTDVVRNEDLGTLVQMLREQHVRKIDVVAPARSITATDGNLTITGSEPVVTDDGVTDVNGIYRPNIVAVEGIAAKLGIPLTYMRRLVTERPDLFDSNVNGWLHGAPRLVQPEMRGVNMGPEEERRYTSRAPIPGDDRSFLVRAFRGDDGSPGMARAFLSDRYGVMDNLDALMAVLEGIERAGVDVRIDGADLSERRMYVRVVSESVRALAPTLLADYRSPFTGDRGADNPVVFAGFVLSNSEVGDGALSLIPRVVIQVCNNGMTITKDVMKHVHLGSRMEHGAVVWSQETESRNIGLISSKAKDAATMFLDQGYLERVVTKIEDHAEKPVEDVEHVQRVTKSLAFTQAQQDKILEHFSRGATWTAGGVMNAVTSAAQEFAADDAAEMESRALPALLAV